MSVMGIQKKFGWRVGGWGGLYPFFWIFGICLTLQRPLTEFPSPFPSLVS